MEFCEFDDGLMLHVTDGNALLLECRICHARRPTTNIIIERSAYSDEYIPEKRQQEDRIMLEATKMPVFRRIERDCESCSEKIMTLFQREEDQRTYYVCANGHRVESVPGDVLPSDW